jgi:hypothetical protein
VAPTDKEWKPAEKPKMPVLSNGAAHGGALARAVGGANASRGPIRTVQGPGPALWRVSAAAALGGIARHAAALAQAVARLSRSSGTQYCHRILKYSTQQSTGSVHSRYGSSIQGYAL